MPILKLSSNSYVTFRSESIEDTGIQQNQNCKQLGQFHEIVFIRMFYGNYFLTLSMLTFKFWLLELHPVALLQSKSDKSFLCATQEKFALFSRIFYY